MCEEAGIQGRKVNHCARKTAITTLVHAGIPPTLVQQHSGHKSLASINNYSTESLNQQKDTSDLLTSLYSKASETVGTPQDSARLLMGLILCSRTLGTMSLIMTLWITCLQLNQCHFPNWKSFSQAPQSMEMWQLILSNSEINLYSNGLKHFHIADCLKSNNIIDLFSQNSFTF